MAVELKIPRTGYEMTEGKIIEWLKREGDAVNSGEPVVVVETQKANIEVESPCDGWLRKIFAEIDEVIQLGQTIAIIAELDENIDNLIAANLKEKEAIDQSDKIDDKPDEIERPSDKEVIVPISGVKKQMAENMLKSKRMSAHATTYNEVDVSNALNIIEKHQKKISFTAILVNASVNALKQYELLNASPNEDTIIIKKYYHIGIAINTENGLFVPVIRDADTKELTKITQEIRELTIKAENSKLTIRDLQKGTFSISNAGRYGSIFFIPIINPPQSAILGAGNIKRRPVVVNDEIVIRPTMFIFVSYDHRIIPGAVAQKFLVSVKENIENIVY